MSNVTSLIPKVYKDFFKECQVIRKVCSTLYSKNDIEQKDGIKITILAAKVIAALGLFLSTRYAFIALIAPSLFASFISLALAGFLFTLSMDLLRITDNFKNMCLMNGFNGKKRFFEATKGFLKNLMLHPKYTTTQVSKRILGKGAKEQLFEKTYCLSVYQSVFNIIKNDLPKNS